MPLTSLELTIDQNRPGWAEQAHADGVALLRQAGRAAMAGELRRAPSAAQMSLETLGRYLRLRLLPGEAPAESPATMLGGGPLRSGLYAGTIPGAVREAWRPEYDREISSSPVVAGHRVVFGDVRGNLHCRHLEDGRVLWAIGGTSPYSTVAIWRDKVFVGAANAHFVCLNLENGVELWRHLTGALVSCAPAVVEGRVLFGSLDNHLYCLEAESGEELWNHNCAQALFSSPTISGGGRVLVGNLGGRLYCFDLEYGLFRWTTSLGGAIYGTPVIAGGRAYVSSHGHHLHCIDLEDGRQLWRAPLDAPKSTTAAVAGDRILIGAAGNAVHCIHRESGELLWKFRAEGDIRAAIATDGRRALVCSAEGRIHCVELERGEELWNHRVGWRQCSSATIAADGRILVGNNDGALVCLEADPDYNPDDE